MIARDLVMSWCSGATRPARCARQQRIFRALHVIQRRRKWWTLWSVLVPMPVLAAPAARGLASRNHRDRTNVHRGQTQFLRRAERGGVRRRGQRELRRNLYNGRILHGVQFRQPDKRDIAHDVLHARQAAWGWRWRISAVPDRCAWRPSGLGTGTIAAYGQQGDYYCFYEINPQVMDIAQQYFTYLSAIAPPRCKVELGDARLSMEQQSPQSYDVIALDAFSGDAIPPTCSRWRRLPSTGGISNPTGVIAVHTSNRHLNLRPIVALIAQHYQHAGRGRVCRGRAKAWPTRHPTGCWSPTTRSFCTAATSLRRRNPLEPPDAAIRVWTDQYSNLFQILTVWQKWKTWWYGEDARGGRQETEPIADRRRSSFRGFQLGLPLVQQLQGLERREAVDFGLPDRVEQRMFHGREQGQLDVAPPPRGPAGADLGPSLFVQVLGLQLGQDLFGPLVHAARHAGQSGHVDAVALVGGAGHDLVQEHHVVFPLLDRHVQIRDARASCWPDRSVRGSAWRTGCGSRRGRASARRWPRPATGRRRCWCRVRSRRGSPGCAARRC